MRAAYENNQDEGFVVLSISQQESAEVVFDFIGLYSLTYPFVLDSNGGVSQTYQIRSTPTTFFIDEDGIIRDVLFGLVTEDWLNQNIRVLQ